MQFNSLFLFFFSALGAFNASILGIYFFVYNKPKHISNYFLGALLITLSIRIWKSIFFYYNRDLSLIYLQIGLSACFLIGPSLYFYLKSVISPEKSIKSSWKYHYLVLVLIIIIVGYLYPYEQNHYLWRVPFIRIIYYQWLAYILLSGFLLKDIFRNILKRVKLNSVEVWILSVYLGNTIIWIAYNTTSYTSYIVGALSFSFVFYLLFLLLLFRKKKHPIQFIQKAKYAHKKIEASEAKILLTDLEKLMLERELHKDPNLKLSSLAKELNIIPHRLSQLINENLGKSFSSYTNEYRINEAKQMLVINNDITVEAIGYECGFNSNSTFYATFKKITGKTPSQYQKDHS